MVELAYLDAYPTGFEFEIKATAVTAESELGTDVFGRHWPVEGEGRDQIPARLLRVGVRFADGRKATNITGQDRPAAGPVLRPLTGRGGGGVFRQAYWVSPLPPPGDLALVCEWPVAGIPLTRYEVDAQMILEAAERARPAEILVRVKDGSEWRIGTDAEIAWIRDGTTPGTAISAAIPPVFDAYATLELPETGEHDRGSCLEDPAGHDEAVLTVLSTHTGAQPWWLGYLNTGAADVIFYDVTPVTLYSDWEYVLIQAGPDQAGRWRGKWDRWKGILPDLMFPADRSWLLSTLWGDHRTFLGGSRQLVDALLAHPELRHRARAVDPSNDDVAPPRGGPTIDS